MSAREDALFEYVATIAFEPKVRTSISRLVAGTGSPVEFLEAVWTCAKQDGPGVAKRIARNGLRAIARPIANEVVGKAFDTIDGWLRRR